MSHARWFAWGHGWIGYERVRALERADAQRDLVVVLPVPRDWRWKDVISFPARA
jgi:hypothetical protein